MQTVGQGPFMHVTLGLTYFVTSPTNNGVMLCVARSRHVFVARTAAQRIHSMHCDHWSVFQVVALVRSTYSGALRCRNTRKGIALLIVNSFAGR